MWFLQAVTLAALTYLIYASTTLERIVMSLQETVDNLTEELARAYGEIKAEIAQLQAQVEAAGVAEQVDFSALQAAADALDGIVPDIATEPEGDLEIVKRDDTDNK
jgi:hypothetical protein